MTSLSINTSCTSMRSALPNGFKPSLDDVIIGRGKKIVAHNKRFLDAVATQAGQYASATSRVVKSSILARVMHHVQDVKKGNFVKLDTASGLWFVVEDSLARSTVAQALRDANSNAYRSSKQFKQRRRKQSKFGSGRKEADEISVSSSGSGSSAGLTTMVTAMDFVRASLNKTRRVSASPEDLLPMSYTSDHQEGRNRYTRSVLKEVLQDTLADEVEWDMDAFPSFPAAQPQGGSLFTMSQQDDFLALLDRTLGVEVPNTPSSANPFEPTPILESASAMQACAYKSTPAQVEDDFTMGDLEDLDIREMWASFEAC